MLRHLLHNSLCKGQLYHSAEVVPARSWFVDRRKTLSDGRVHDFVLEVCGFLSSAGILARCELRLVIYWFRLGLIYRLKASFIHLR